MDVPASYVFAGGGSGGHLFPGIAVAEELHEREPQARIVFVGTDRAVERKILARHGYDHVAVPAEPLGALLRNPLGCWRFWKACRLARLILEDERPRGVVGLGGYASAPTVIASSSLGIPTILLEQNAVAGRATRWLSGRASLVCLSFAQTRDKFSSRASLCVTGNPVRRSISQLAHTPVDNDANPYRGSQGPALLILGGSQGAIAVNEIVLHMAPTLHAEFPALRIVHQTGEQHCATVRSMYDELGIAAIVQPFFPDIADLYRTSDIVISRAGATTLAELACAGCPAVLIPYPGSAGDHQLWNARAYESAGAARVIEQQGGHAGGVASLGRTLRELLADPARLAEMRSRMRAMAHPQAAADVVDRLERLITGQTRFSAGAVEEESVGERR